jgi:hypothetical protein
MFGKALTTVALKRAARLITISAIATLVATAGNTADLHLRIHVVPGHEARPAGLEARKQLFQEFLKFLKDYDRR